MPQFMLILRRKVLVITIFLLIFNFIHIDGIFQERRFNEAYQMRTSTKTQHKLDMDGVRRWSCRGIKRWGFWKMNIWIKYLSSYTLSFQLSFIFRAMKFKTNYLLSDKDTWYSCSNSPKEKQPSPNHKFRYGMA